nr:10633_t:CDS:2 [Entrophospora candida]
MPELLCNIFRDRFKSISQNNVIMDIGMKFVSEECNMLGKTKFGEWLDQPEKLGQITRQLAKKEVWPVQQEKIREKLHEGQILYGADTIRK